MKKSRKNDVINRANCIIRKIGYTNLSFSQIAKDLEITRENVHHYFKKKEDLGLACLFLMKEDLAEKFNNIIKEDNSSFEKLQNYFSIYKINQDSKEDCPIVPLLSEFELLPIQMQEEIKALSDLEVEKLSVILEEGLKNKQFFYKEETNYKAIIILSMLKGAVSYGKIYNNFKIISEKILKDLKGN